jgi:anti-sigma regulatory factor (Ser/Thr protein kinase)
MIPEELILNCPNQMEQLEDLADRVEEFAAEHDLSPKTIFQIKLCVEEIFVNIVSYAFPDCDEERNIRISLNWESGVLTMRIEDDGVPFNPLEFDPPDVQTPLEDRPSGGLGLHLTKNMMNEMHYTRSGGKNILIMKKTIDSAPKPNQA